MSASTTQDISTIEAKLATIEDVLIRLHGLLGCLIVLDNPMDWKDQVERLHKETAVTGAACVAAFSLSAVDLQITSNETDIAIRKERAIRRAQMQEALRP